MGECLARFGQADDAGIGWVGQGDDSARSEAAKFAIERFVVVRAGEVGDGWPSEGRSRIREGLSEAFEEHERSEMEILGHGRDGLAPDRLGSRP